MEENKNKPVNLSVFNTLALKLGAAYVAWKVVEAPAIIAGMAPVIGGPLALIVSGAAVYFGCKFVKNNLYRVGYNEAELSLDIVKDAVNKKFKTKF